MSRYNILDSLFDGIVVVDRDRNIVFANKLYLEICGIKKEDIIGKKCYEASHRCPVLCSLADRIKRPAMDTKSSFICPGEEVFLTGKPVTVTHIHYCFGEEERVFEITASPFTDEKGAVTEMLEILRDVTDREKALNEAMKAKAFVSNIFDSIGEGVIVIDRSLRIISANSSYLKQVKNSIDNVIGKHCYEVSHRFDKPCYEKGEECGIKDVLETGEKYGVIHTHHDKDGNPIYVAINLYPVKDSSGNVTSVIECIDDITEKMNLETDLKKKVNDLEDFYDLAVGRELKMIELKKEIESLKEELERYKKTKN
ncbi:MAG: PAS domain-containing protein [Nitrospirota bacterium]